MVKRAGEAAAAPSSGVRTANANVEAAAVRDAKAAHRYIGSLIGISATVAALIVSELSLNGARGLRAISVRLNTLAGSEVVPTIPAQ